MITRIPFCSVYLAAFAIAFLPLPRVSAQLAEIIEEDSLQLAINYGGEDERRLSSHKGVIEPLGLVYNQLQPVTLLCSEDKAGQTVTLSPLDGGVEIIVNGIATATDSRATLLSVANDGTADFVLKGPLPGTYRILVTIGADQYELQFHVRRFSPDTGPFSTPPPN
jgi:hypothetical protein